MYKIENLVRYPVKGAHGEQGDALFLDPHIGVIGDRQYGLKREDSVPDTWSPKGKFHVAMNSPIMPTLKPVFDSRVWARTGPDFWNTLSSDWIRRLPGILGVESSISVLDTHRKFNLTDDEKPYVSFLNLASLGALSEFMGMEIDPRRFRMNVWYEGDPFEELDWVKSLPGTHEIVVDNIRFRVGDMCERCKAIEANPETGTYDLELLAGLRGLLTSLKYEGSPKRHSMMVMGFLAQPLSKGSINRGGSVTV